MRRRAGETSYKDTAFGVISRSKLIPLEIEGIKKAWDFVLKQRENGQIPLTVSFLQKIHKVGFGWIFPESAGKFRTIEVTVSQHEPPRYFKVPQLMQDFIDDLKVRLKSLPKFEDEIFLKELVELLAWAHHRFVWIHPFFDYNGRMGRLLMSMVLMNLSLPPIELQVETPSGRVRYIKSLAEADVGDFTALQKIIHSALEEEAKKLF